MADEHPAGPPPREAVSYLRRKGVRTGFSYEDVWGEEHGFGFTVAKMMQMDLLADVQRSIAEAARDGTTMEQWKKEMAERLSKRGWWGRKEVVDPKTGKTVVAQLGSSRRLDTIWRVNMGQAAQAGAWERGMRSTSHPYVLYRVGPSRVHRDQHLAWDGLVLRRDDPFWAAANPRNGWGCKCYTRFVSEAQYKRYQRDGIAAPVVGDGQPGTMDIKTKLVDAPAKPDEAPALKRMTYANKRTGEAHRGYAGIDPGFEYNPGTSRQQQLRTQWRDRDRIFAGQMEPHPDATPVRQGLDASDAGSQRSAATHAIRAVEQVHGAGRLTIDPDAEDVVPLPFKESDTTDRQGEHLHSPITGRPTRIDLSSAGEEADRWPALIAAEEIGHYLDHAGMSGRAADVGDWESYAQRTPEMRAVMKKIRESPTYALLPKGGTGWIDQPWELWGRAYAQYIAWRSGSSRLKGELDKVLTHADPAKQVRYWPYDEFAPIAAAIDRLMEARTWARRKQGA